MNSSMPCNAANYFVSGAAKLAGVIGWPVSHSLSPRLHGYWLRNYQIDGLYMPLAAQPDDLADVLRALPKLGFRGANVTVPHKERTLSLVHRATSAARRIGAVNTIVVDSNGLLIGSNTDAFGFLESLREEVCDWQADRGPAVVLGAGGAARAIVFALLEEGAPEIRLLNRTLARSHALAAELGGPVRVLPWADRGKALGGAVLLVNATTLGMQNQPVLELDLTNLPRSAVVYDLVYAPLDTMLLKAARERGHLTVGGLGMLLHQARPGFAAWYGQMPDVTPELRQILMSGFGPS